MREVIARIVDGSDFHEFKALYGTTLVSGFARLDGMPVAILANNGVLFTESALKGAHFIELAASVASRSCSFKTFWASWSARTESGGIAKNGAKLVMASPDRQVPKITVVIGGSFGAGNYGMSGRAYRRAFCSPGRTRASASWAANRPRVSWPPSTATISQHPESLDAGARGSLKAPIRQNYEGRGKPYYATARLWDDGVMGSKSGSKALMEKAGVPLVPGYHGEAQDEATLAKAADKIGFPVLVKASAGGGGRGMRAVNSAGELSAAIVSAKREAKAAFGDDRMLIEKFVKPPAYRGADHRRQPRQSALALGARVHAAAAAPEGDRGGAVADAGRQAARSGVRRRAQGGRRGRRTLAPAPSSSSPTARKCSSSR